MLEGPRVRLRQIRPEDVEPLVALMNDQANFEGGLRYLLVSAATLASSVQENNQVEPDRFTLAVEVKEGNELIGTAHVYPAHAFYPIPEIGMYIYPRAERQQGYGFEATALVVDFLFLTRPVPKVQMVTNARNDFLVGVLCRFGFEVEAVMRKVCYSHRRFQDYVVVSMLREAWRTARDRPEVAFLRSAH